MLPLLQRALRFLRSNAFSRFHIEPDHGLDYLKRASQCRSENDFNRLHIELDHGLDYLKLASRCRSENDFNRLHIELENICTPLELAHVAELAQKRNFPKESLDWLERLQALKPELFVAPHPYERRLFAKSLVQYRSSGFEPAKKSLLVGFTGYARRLMMPIPVFLQFVDPDKWDVIVLTKTRDHVTTDFPNLVEYIKATFYPASYRRVVTFGTSGGGFAAIWAARLMDVDRGISIGGFTPDPLPLLAGADRAACRADLCYVYGSDFSRDHDWALALQNRFGGRLRAVRDINTHNIFGKMIKRGELTKFLDEMLF